MEGVNTLWGGLGIVLVPKRVVHIITTVPVGRIGDCFSAKACGTYNYHCALKNHLYEMYTTKRHCYTHPLLFATLPSAANVRPIKTLLAAGCLKVDCTICTWLLEFPRNMKLILSIIPENRVTTTENRRNSESPDHNTIWLTHFFLIHRSTF